MRTLLEALQAVLASKGDPGRPELFGTIRHGSAVTIVDRFGKERTGKAVMFNREYGSWTLNMGGRYGTPAIATPQNVTEVWD